MTVGRAYSPEWRDYLDPLTGRRVRQLTDSSAEDYHLYFYNPSVTPDGKYLIFISERTGVSNLFRLDLANGAIVQLTDARPIRGEYWPFTESLNGVGACLPAIGNRGQEVFYFEGTDLFALEIESLKQRQLLSLPPDRRPSMLQADAGGGALVFATWDESLFMERSQRAYAGEKFPDERFFQETSSTIVRVDAETAEAEEVLCKEKFWINHVHLNPLNRDLILFCHEYSELPDRMWLLDVANRQYKPIPGQGIDEWYQHEFWSHDGKRICFHGGLSRDNTQGFCGWCAPDGTNYHKAFHSTSGRAYAHYNLHMDGQTMVTDGEARPGCISKVRLRDECQEFEILCRHDSYTFGDDQRCHPHPSFTPNGQQVIFTSNRTGTSNVYLTDWN
ncbi:MAG TPA: oligogalacturonate lyase family protein [Anaerolineales bacterium]|nr:oligogalacturonate lyase family protein [Anaerolineales bacterium]